jgi:hypothetical protein
MNNAFFNNPAIAEEPLSVAYYAEDLEGPYSGTRIATVYKRGRLEHWPEGSCWAFEWRVVTGYEDDPRIVSNRCYQYYDDAEAAADTWVFHPEVA